MYYLTFSLLSFLLSFIYVYICFGPSYDRICEIFCNLYDFAQSKVQSINLQLQLLTVYRGLAVGEII